MTSLLLPPARALAPELLFSLALGVSRSSAIFD
jgi:hypothetical protein